MSNCELTISLWRKFVLMKNDKEIFGIKTNSRVFLVAKSYFDAISAYFKIK